MNNLIKGSLIGIALGVAGSLIVITGTGPEVGDPPTDELNKPLDSKFFTVVVVKAADDGKIFSSFGKFEAENESKEAANAEVNAAIKNWLDPNHPEFDKWDANKIAEIKEYSGYDFNINNFGFGSKQRLYFVLANESLRFDNEKPITFVKYSMQEKDPGKRKIHKNKSFYNASLLKDMLVPKDRILYVENHFRKPGFLGIGNADIDKKKDKMHYSFNLNLWADSARDPHVEIPTVVDPDTGNGMGWTP